MGKIKKLVIKGIVVLSVAFVFFVFLSTTAKQAIRNDQTERDEELFYEGFPRAFFFRGAENTKNIKYKNWEKTYNRLGGIIGKCMEEEVPGRSKNIPFFTRFKKENPQQQVLLHYNGNGRDPRDNSAKFNAGHWLYYEGSQLLENLAADTGLAEIKVKDASIYKLNIGRYKTSNEDIVIYRQTPSGTPDWNYAEQVQLIDTDTVKNTILVKRGCYGSEPLAFKAGSAMAAAHATEGPWGDKSNLMWFYNHSTFCPTDEAGNTCDDIIVKELAEKFAKGGDLQYFDGLEFDVLWNQIDLHGAQGRKIDADGDGIGDQGIIDGVNTYSTGVYEFCKDLRNALGNERLIMADGWASELQRAVPFLNGIESEGWPMHRDPKVKDWSGGWNRHLFWNLNSFQPGFSFVNFKYTQGVKQRGEVPPLAQQRLVWAAAQMFDARFTHSGYAVSHPQDGIYTEIIDELVAGVRKEKYWLGQPKGPAVRLALQQPDVLNGAGMNITDNFIEKWNGENISIQKENNSVKLYSSESGDMHFKLENIPCKGPDLLVSAMFRCDPRKNYPADMTRLINVYSSEDDYHMMTLVNENWFHATFYFRDVNQSSIDIHFEVESNEPVWIKDISIHAHPDAVYREFENGLVLGNPSSHEYQFNLNDILPGKKYKRIMASPGQDTIINNGKPEGAEITLGVREGLFLERLD